MTFNVNILPLVMGMILNMVLGALWYSNILFAKPWMKESGVTEERMSDTKGMGLVYGLTMAMALITSYVVGIIIINLGVTTIGQVLVVAVIMWLGTDLPMIIKNWGFEGRTIKLGVINHSYQLVVYALVGTLFVLL